MNAIDRALFEALSGEQILGLTIFGEAEGEKLRGKFAVGFAIFNRARLWKQAIHRVCLAHNQFECFNDGNRRLPLLKNLAQNFTPTGVMKDSFIAAQGVLSGNVQSNIGLSTFYKTIRCRSPWFDRAVAKGVLRPFCVIDAHQFYIETRFEEV